ncbi:MFS transporter [Halomarina pelagica]|uniref:MFS transporter n=1 Tax=Halomarina pelagica TaxID=2961599 RepID=UPI0020C274BF|nr:MFS transporter [Halomarina sp. BND7]
MRSLRRSAAEVPRGTALVVGLVSGSHAVNHMYLVLLPPVLPTLAREFEVSLAALGVAMGAQAFVNTVCQLPYGYLADERDRTLTLGLCLTLGSIGALILALAPTFEWLLVGQVVVGLGVAGHHPAHFPLLADATAERNRARAFSVHGFAGNLGFAAPPVLITAIAAHPALTWRHAFGLIGGVGLLYAAVAVVTLLRGVDPEIRRSNADADVDAPPGREPRSVGDRLRAGIRSIASAPGILGLGLFALVASTVMWGVTSFVVVLLTEGYGLDSGTANLALSSAFVVGAGLILIGGDLADRVGPGPVLVGSYLLVAAFVFALASFAVPPLVAAVCAVCAGSVGSLSLPARDKLADALSARGDVGKNFAVITVGIMIGNAVAPPVFGALIESSGLSPAFAAIAAVALLAVALVGTIVRRVDGAGVGAKGAGTGGD